jgi:hypothetical protein
MLELAEADHARIVFLLVLASHGIPAGVIQGVMRPPDASDADPGPPDTRRHTRAYTLL